MTPYPIIYTPRGVNKPACCAHNAPNGLLSGIGPDADDQTGKGGGEVWGGTYTKGQPWRKSRAGWYWLDQGHRPQDLARLTCHPRLVKWTVVPGAVEGQWWRVPIIVAPTPTPPDAEGKTSRMYLSALDRVWGWDGYGSPADLEDLQRRCIAVAIGSPLADTPADRDAACARLAIDLLREGHWIDEGWMIEHAWLTESVQIRVIRAAIGVNPDTGDLETAGHAER